MPSLSSLGRYLAFESVATNLVAGDTNATRDVFVRNRATGTTMRASLRSNGAESDDQSFEPAVTEDGLVFFASFATNLVAGDTGQKTDIFRHDLRTEGPGG